jgi:ABC-type branched-subunit amino acid transport system ATPase component
MLPQRICRLEVRNFKSLVDFQIDLPKFTCIIGLNGAGKSTVLQFIDFLSHLVRGDMQEWLVERKWKPAEIKSKLTRKMNIEFRVGFCDATGKSAGQWTGVYSPGKRRCTSERIETSGSVLDATDNTITAKCDKKASPKKWKNWSGEINFDYEGSILSALRPDKLPPSLLTCKRMLRTIESLDTLTPESLRRRTREAHGSLGHGGKNLSAFLFELGPDGRRQLTENLKNAYHRLGHVYSKSLRSGWKQLFALERFGDVKMVTEATHLNDGMLRMIAIVAELQSEHQFLLFDEIENGINPELVEFVINMLVQAQQQVLVTTHSPMILNYLEDDVARKGVIYLYKTAEGHTQSIPFFSIPSLSQKLEVMGPGEAFVDTNLTELAHEIAAISKEPA